MATQLWVFGRLWDLNIPAYARSARCFRVHAAVTAAARSHTVQKKIYKQMRLQAVHPEKGFSDLEQVMTLRNDESIGV